MALISAEIAKVTSVLPIPSLTGVEMTTGKLVNLQIRMLNNTRKANAIK